LTALSEWLDVELAGEDAARFSELYNETTEALGDSELGFSMLVPDDEVDIGVRMEEVSGWCAGFLYGFGMTGRFQREDLSDDVSEVLSDLGKIAAAGATGDVPEDEDNEADLMEILEYVRMAALLIHAECAHKAVH